MLDLLLNFVRPDWFLFDGSNGLAGPAKRRHAGGLWSAELLVPIGRCRRRFHLLNVFVLIFMLFVSGMNIFVLLMEGLGYRLASRKDGLILRE